MASTLVALQTVTVGAGGAANISFTNIPQTYTDLMISASVRDNSSSVAQTFAMQLNGTGGTSYTWKRLQGNGATASSDGYSFQDAMVAGPTNGATSTSNTFNNTSIYIPNYTSSNNKSVSFDSVSENNATTAYTQLNVGLFSTSSAVTSITLYSTAGNLVQYSTATLYGVYKDAAETTPAAPTIGTATAGSQAADVAFTPAGSGAPASSYVVTSSPGGLTATGASSPIQIGGLTSGTAYTFTVRGQNPGGLGAASAASNSVTPYDGYESIATLYGDGASSVTFSSIPQTYTHLQVRTFIKGSLNDQDVWVNFNGDTASNYSEHRIYGNGSSVVSGGLAPSSKIEYFGRSGSGTSVFGPSIVDILDYKDTNKYTTVRALTGWDNNGSGFVMFTSGSWRSTAAITSMLITPQGGTFAAGTVFELYGIRG